MGMGCRIQKGEQMKIEMTEEDWNEITTKRIKVTGRFKWDVLDGQSPSEWVKANRRLHLTGKHRMYCNCCQDKFDGMPGKLFVYQTNNGNKVVCQKCSEKIGKNFKVIGE